MTATDEPTSRLWARTRRRAYAEITSVAMELFLAKGFEQTTIDEIVSAAGISRRSFFRYFGTKEDVVLSHFVAEGAVLRAALEGRPDDEDVWTALRAAILSLEESAGDQQRMLAVSRMLYRTPSLRARSIEKHLRWYDHLMPEVQRRLGHGADGTLRARAVVGCVVTCLDLAGEAWTDDDAARPLSHYLDAALDAVRHEPA